MLEYAVCEHDGPIAIRYPRGNAYEIERRLERSSEEEQESCLAPDHLTRGQDVLLFAVGNMAQTALEAADYLEKNNISTEVVNVKCVFPLQEDALLKIVEKHPSRLIVTLEDNVIEGGFGNRLAAWLGAKGIRKDVQCLGIPSKFVEHGAVDELRRTLGLDPNGIAKRVQMKLKIRRRP
jgi:1-deoxy-D-xylulose-5-phosphate synthase